MLWWMCPLKETFTTLQAKDLVEVLPHVRQFFIQGAPAMYLNDNPNPKLRVCNGARSRMHSLIYYEGMPRDLITKIINITKEMERNNFSNALIQVPVPDAVMLEIENPKTGNLLYPTKLMTTAFRSLLSGTKPIDINRHCFQPGFAYTFYKAQGLTIKRVIIQAYKRPGARNKFLKMKINDLYVGLSRVREPAHVRLEYDMEQGLCHDMRINHLYRLRYNNDLRD